MKYLLITTLLLSGCASNSTVFGLTQSSIALGDTVSGMKREEIAFRIQTKNKILELEQRICDLERSSSSKDLDKKFRKYMSK